MAKKKVIPPARPIDFNETRLRTGESVGLNAQEHEHKQVHEHEHEQEHKPVSVNEPEQKENKTKHLHILTHESLVERMDAYAAKRGVKRIAVFEAAMNDYLDRVDPQE